MVPDIYQRSQVLFKDLPGAYRRERRRNVRPFGHTLRRETRFGRRRLTSTLIDLSNLRHLFRKKSWKNLIPIIDRLILEIRHRRLSALLINELILATIPDSKMINNDAFLKEVLYSLHQHFKDIKAFYDIRQRGKALHVANRCREIVESAKTIQKAADDEGLAPLKISELEVVDEFKGRKVYRVKSS